jgi:hypothetical protein
MDLDWNIIGSASTALASIATAVGVLFVAWQIRLTKKQAQAEFEDSLDQQYRALSMLLPVDVLIGKHIEPVSPEIRELIFNYLDLTNEQVYLRAKGRISELTWKSWCLGVSGHMSRPYFKEVYDEVKEASGFTYLDRLIESEYKSDPLFWFK